jgi:hypothetical protein
MSRDPALFFTDARICNLIHEVDLALVSIQQKLGGMRIPWISARYCAAGRDGIIDNRHVVSVFNLNRGPHRRLNFDCVVKPGNRVLILTLLPR